MGSAALLIAAAAAGRSTVNETFELWGWTREPFSMAVCRIGAVRVEPEDAVRERVFLELRLVETLWGAPPPEVRKPSFARRSDEIARVKSPDEVWGNVELSTGALVFVASRDPAADPFYAAKTAPDDLTLQAVRKLLAAERELKGDPAARKALYLSWLREGRLVQRLFAGQALSRDPLPGVDQDGEVARAIAKILGDERADVFLRLSAVGWLHEYLWARTSARGKAAALQADAKALGAKDANVRRFALDALVDLDPLMLRQLGVADAQAAALLRQHAVALDEARRRRLEQLAEAVTPRQTK